MKTLRCLIALAFLLALVPIAAVVMAALLILLLYPMWWTQCQLFNFLFDGHSTWACLK